MRMKIVLVGLFTAAVTTVAARAQTGWPHYGGDPGVARVIPPPFRLTTRMCRDFKVAWTYRTGDVSDGSDGKPKSKFEATPILFNGRLYLSTPFDRVIALDPSNGKQRWRGARMMQSARLADS